MKAFFLVSLTSVLLLTRLSRTSAAPTLECDAWRFAPSDDPLRDVGNTWPKDENGMPNGDGDLYTAICLMLAVNTKPPIHEFLEKLVGLNHSISSCTPEFSLKINTVGKVFGEQRPSVVRDIPFMAADFAFAKDNVKNSPIWPAIVRKAAEAIARAHTASNTEKLLMGDGEEPFNCAIDVKFAMSLSIYDRLAYKRQYLCKISDLVSRFTGIRLRSTPMLMEDTKEEKTNITKILEDSQHGLTVVFDKWAPTYLVRNNAEDNENRKYKVKEFEAVWLNITKHGNSRDMNFALHNFVASERYKYQDIMDHKGGEERDVHLVYPYQA